VWASGCLGTRAGMPAPAGSWPAYAHRQCRSCGRPDAWGRGQRPAPCRIAAKRLTLTGGADCVGVRMPDRGRAADAHRRCRSCGRPDAGFWPDAYVATPVHLATGTRLPPVDAAQANVGPRGREWRHLPDRGQAATSRCQSTGHNVRERGTGERRDTGAGTAAWPETTGGTCRIAAKRLPARRGHRPQRP